MHSIVTDFIRIKTFHLKHLQQNKNRPQKYISISTHKIHKQKILFSFISIANTQLFIKLYIQKPPSPHKRRVGISIAVPIAYIRLLNTNDSIYVLTF